MKTTSNTQATENWLMIVTIALVLFGVFMVFDASYVRAGDAPYTGFDSYYFLKRQAIWALIGLLAFRIGMKTNYQLLRRYWKPLMYITMFMLVAVMVPGIGKMANGARRHLGFGPMRVQPSEVAKLAFIVYLSHHFAKRPFMKWHLEDRMKFLGLTVLAMLLIAKEPDLGTALAMAGAAASLIYLGGMPAQLFAGATLLGAAGIGMLIWLEPYRMGRIGAWLDPWKYYETYGFQVVHGLVALGSGGPLGRGPCNSLQKFHYLPACHTDFIFAIIGEEFGLWGTLLLVATVACFCFLGLSIAHRTRNAFGAMMATGITAMVGTQAMLNIAVVSGLTPATGVPLPLISYGGSSMVVTLFSIGVLFNISRNPGAGGPSEGSYESDSDRRRHRRAHLSRSQRRGGSIQSWQDRNSVRRHR